MLSKASFILVVLGCYLGLVYCCVPPDCDRLDCGTCGNACCTYEYYFSKNIFNLKFIKKFETVLKLSIILKLK